MFFRRVCQDVKPVIHMWMSNSPTVAHLSVLTNKMLKSSRGLEELWHLELTLLSSSILVRLCHRQRRLLILLLGNTKPDSHVRCSLLRPDTTDYFQQLCPCRVFFRFTARLVQDNKIFKIRHLKKSPVKRDGQEHLQTCLCEHATEPGWLMLF